METEIVGTEFIPDTATSVGMDHSFWEEGCLYF